LPKCDRS